MPDDYFRWQPTPASPVVRLNRAVMKRIEEQCLANPAQNWGALIGRHEADEFLVDDCAALPDGAPPAGFIGLYRNQLRPGLQISPGDCAMVEKLLPRSDGVLLLVKPLSARECVGALFFCEGGAVVDEAVASREFPLSTPTRITKQSRLGFWIPLSAALAGIAMASVFHFRQPPAQPEETPIAATLPLRAEPNGSNARIEWDASSRVLEGATSATIDVADGNSRKALRLTPADLHTGYVEWTPHAADVTFDMRVDRPGEAPATGQVRFVNRLYPINSSSDTPNPKPAPPVLASASTGDERQPLRSRYRPREVAVRELASNAHEPEQHQSGRVKRIFGGITAKASHLWPFRSAKPAQQTQ